MDQLQVPPNSLDAERAVLGSMLIDKDAVERALEIVAETDFYADAHRIVFRAMADLHQACKPVDLLIVAEELRTRNQLGDVGGVQALGDFIHKVATAAHLEHYARIVHEKAVLRELISTATRVVQECYSEKEAAVVLDDAQNQIIAVAQRQTSNKFTDA
ncbi:MAG: replicative DNA helicase, partial [Elusimicrobia bacterium]|nr:replicative DNA helicase [Elusimicrobiota bacterium]